MKEITVGGKRGMSTGRRGLAESGGVARWRGIGDRLRGKSRELAQKVSVGQSRELKKKRRPVRGRDNGSCRCTVGKLKSL